MPDVAPDAHITQFENAVIGRTDLPAAFDGLAAIAGGSAALMFSLVDGRPGIVGGAIAPTLQKIYQLQNWKSSDVLTARVRALPADVVLFAQDFLPLTLIETSAFFQNYLAQFDILWGAGWVFDLGEERWAFAIARSRAQGPFEPDDRDLLTRVAPRMTRCLLLLNAVSQAHAQGACDALDVRDRPYVTIDHRGLVSRISPRAEAILKDDALCVRDLRLVSSNADANEKLQNIALCAKYGAEGAANAGASPPEEFFIPRVGRAPVMITPLRLRPTPLDVLPGVQFLLRISDFAQHPTPRAKPLKALFNLSPREIEIAQRIAAGEDPVVIAESLGLKTSSVRQVIKSIFAKTGLHRFGQLVALLSRLPDVH